MEWYSAAHPLVQPDAYEASMYVIIIGCCQRVPDVVVAN